MVVRSIGRRSRVRLSTRVWTYVCENGRTDVERVRRVPHMWNGKDRGNNDSLGRFHVFVFVDQGEVDFWGFGTHAPSHLVYGRDNPRVTFNTGLN